MPASEARIQANRLNALKSTGPKTEAGKAASRGNAYKHGLTGSGVAAPDEHLAAVEEMAADLRAELRPTSALGRVLVDRLAAMTVRMDRCVKQEAAAISARVRWADRDFDESRADEVDAWFGLLVGDDPAGSDPGPLLRRLRRSPEGIARLIEAWADLASALRRPDLSPWGERHVRTFEALSGRRTAGLFPSRAALVSRVLMADDVSGLGAAEAGTLAALDARARTAWAREQLAHLMADAVEELRAAREEIDLEAIELDRDGAATVALFDPSREATLARKYEAAAERGFYRALREFEQAEAMAEPEARAASPSSSTARGSLASFFPKSAPSPVRDGDGPTYPRTGPVERSEELSGASGTARVELGAGGDRS